MLFSYEGDRVFKPSEALRICPYSKRELHSDVFIFEASDIIEHYVLAILKGNIANDLVEPETYYTLNVTSLKLILFNC